MLTESNHEYLMLNSLALQHNQLLLNISLYLVDAVGFEPTVFTLRERIYSPLQHHRRCRTSFIWYRRQGSNLHFQLQLRLLASQTSSVTPAFFFYA